MCSAVSLIKPRVIWEERDSTEELPKSNSDHVCEAFSSWVVSEGPAHCVERVGRAGGGSIRGLAILGDVRKRAEKEACKPYSFVASASASDFQGCYLELLL